VVSDERSSKEKILKKVRKGLLQKGDPYTTNLDLDTDVYVKEVGELIETFSGNFHANRESLLTALMNMILLISSWASLRSGTGKV
jgi:hypothetical protein